MIRKRPNRGFPLKYYPGEILTEIEASRNRKMVYSYLRKLPKKAKKKVKVLYFYFLFGLTISQPLAPCAAVMVTLPTPIHRIQPHTLDSIGTSPRSVPVVVKRPNKVVYTEKLDEMAYQLMDGKVSLEELVLELRGGDVKEAALYIGLIIMLAYITSTAEYRDFSLFDHQLTF